MMFGWGRFGINWECIKAEPRSKGIEIE